MSLRTASTSCTTRSPSYPDRLSCLTCVMLSADELPLTLQHENIAGEAYPDGEAHTQAWQQPTVSACPSFCRDQPERPVLLPVQPWPWATAVLEAAQKPWREAGLQAHPAANLPWHFPLSKQHHLRRCSLLLAGLLHVFLYMHSTVMRVSCEQTCMPGRHVPGLQAWRLVHWASWIMQLT